MLQMCVITHQFFCLILMADKCLDRSITAGRKEYYGARTDGGDEQTVSDCGNVTDGDVNIVQSVSHTYKVTTVRM